MGTELSGILSYQDLDSSSHAERAVQRMEARASEPASERLFAVLVQPLLTPAVRRILEVGCGSGALARRVARLLPAASVLATDKSQAMISAAQAIAANEALPNLRFQQWDATQPLWSGGGKFDLLLSSVMVPYLSDEETHGLITRCADLLAPGGQLAFIEQDLLTDSLNVPDFELFKRVYGRDERRLKRTLALGLRPVLRDAGLKVEPRASFLWTDEGYGAYVRDLLEKTAGDAAAAGRISEVERLQWNRQLEAQAEAGDFYYGLVYHRVVGTKR